MTAAALEKLKAEYKQKTEVERLALAARLKAAIELGDLSENAEYTTAKEAQGFLEGRIQQLQAMIRGAVIIEEGQACDTVQLGCRVTVLEENEEEPEVFLIVGMVEANPREGKISIESPLGEAIAGAKVGDCVTVKAPAGILKFKVLDIQ
nr:transcription elongation factor GreA [Anaerolineae bacterium]